MRKTIAISCELAWMLRIAAKEKWYDFRMYILESRGRRGCKLGHCCAPYCPNSSKPMTMYYLTHSISDSFVAIPVREEAYFRLDGNSKNYCVTR